jgi:hypothetical protein
MLQFDPDVVRLKSRAELGLVVPALQATVKTYIHMVRGASTISDRTLQTLNEVVGMTPEHVARIEELIYEHAMFCKGLGDWGVPDDDPRNPCYLPNGSRGVAQR